ncbi:Ribonuclease P protein subunit p14 [Basidiobolus ranarum]|uniref:Ribonuclease P protein subunit p14 n=1 Tax=Basidiobolus ranarum TaxID=34480 RepID=A0ABR2VXT7_9FUNG
MEVEPTIQKKPSTFQRFTLSSSQWQYLKVQVIFEETKGANEHTIDELLLRSLIVQSLNTLHGLVGSAMQVDVLSFKDLVGILRVANDDLPALWSALTLYQGTHNGVDIQIRVLSVSAYLLGLASDSRSWDI